jgi:hypothetical protein
MASGSVTPIVQYCASAGEANASAPRSEGRYHATNRKRAE